MEPAPRRPQVLRGRHARGDRTRLALVDAALALFDDKGVEATSVDEITTAARVAKGTFYVHFQRKQDVLLERAAQITEALEDERAGDDVPAALESLGGRLSEVMGAMPRPVMGRMMREIVGNRDEWLRVLGDRPTLAATIQPLVERGQAAGALRSDLSPRRLAQGLTILWLDGIIGWAERAEARPLAVDLARATALFLSGART